MYRSRQKVGKYEYIYQIESYRSEGAVKKRKTRIGRVDPETRKVVYTDPYLEDLLNAGQALPTTRC